MSGRPRRRPARQRRALAAGALVVAIAYVRVSRERRAAATAFGDGRVQAWEPPAITRLASWVPDAPAGGGARLAAYLWAGPLTLAGLLVGLSTGVRPRARAGVLLFERARGPVAAYLRTRRFSACTLGHVIIALRDVPPPLLAHELVHVRQGERLGPLLAPLYLALLVVYGYHRHPLERAARRAQRASAPARPGRH
jgi:hypothetical protein